MHPFGSIFHHEKLVFHDGSTGKKYMILLNSPSKGEPYIFVKTTSQKKNKPETPGCIKSISLFFIKGGKTFFPDDTWVQLFELYPIESRTIRNDSRISLQGELNKEITHGIIDCLFKTQEDDIPDYIKEMIRPPIDDAMKKLQERFNRR